MKLNRKNIVLSSAVTGFMLGLITQTILLISQLSILNLPFSFKSIINIHSDYPLFLITAFFDFVVLPVVAYFIGTYFKNKFKFFEKQLEKVSSRIRTVEYMLQDLKTSKNGMSVPEFYNMFENFSMKLKDLENDRNSLLDQYSRRLVS